MLTFDRHLAYFISRFILTSVAAPIVCWLGLALAVPYAFAHSVAPLVVTSPTQRNLLARRVYPALLLIAVLAAGAVFQVRERDGMCERRGMIGSA